MVYGQRVDSALVAFERSYTLEEEGDYEGAIKVLRKGHRKTNYSSTLRMAWLHYLAKRLTESVDYYEKAIEISPKSIEARLGMTYPLAALEHWDDVIAQYEDILKIDAQNYLANYHLGIIYFVREDYTKCKTFLDKIYALYPFEYDLLMALGKLHYQMDKFDEAKEMYHQALFYRPKDAAALEALEKVK